MDNGRSRPVDLPLSNLLIGRAAAVIFFICGIAATLSTLFPMPPAVNQRGVATIGLVAAVTGVLIWFSPWHRWRRGASLWLILPGFLLIAIHNHFAADPYPYSLFFIVSFAWIGVGHPRGTAIRATPLVAAAYLIPLWTSGYHDPPVVGYVVLTVVVCVVVGEVLAGLSERLGRVQAELLSRQSAERFHALLEHSSDMVAVTDADGLRSYASPSYEQVLGYPPEDLLGRHISAIDLPEDAPCTREILAELRNDPGGVRGFDSRVQHRDGSVRWLEVIATNRLEEPGAGGIVINSRDVTARKEAEERQRKDEERLRLALVAARMGTWDYDLQTEEITGSEALGALLGLPPGRPHYSYASFLEHVHPDDRELVAEADRRAIDEGVEYGVEFRFIQPDGSTRWFAEQGHVAERDAGGRAQSMLGVTADITERKQAELLRERQARDTALRGAVSRALAVADTLPGMLQRCAEAAVDHFAGHATVWLLDDQDQALELAASAGALWDPAQGDSRVPVGRFRVGRVAAERKPVLTNDLAGDRQEGDGDWASRAGMVAFAGHPLLVEDRLVGVLAIFAAESLAEDTLEALASVADAIAQGIERKRAEEALQVSEERFREAFDHAASGMALVSLDGHFFQVNASMCALTGYAEPELLTKTFREITHPEDLEADLDQAHRLLAGEIRAYQIEKRFIRKDGGIVWVRLSRSLVHDRCGEPLHFIAQNEDITERKHAEEELRASEERLRAILLQIADGVMMTDPTGRVTFVNDAARRLIGVDKTGVALEDFDNTYAALTMEGQPYPLEELPHVQALRDEEPVSRLRMRFRRPDGTEVVAEAGAAPVLAEGGSRLGAVLTLRDITDRFELERYKDEFFTNVSHDLRTPLAEIKASIGVVRANEPGDMPEPLRRLLLHVDDAADRMALLIEDLLELTRLQAGTARLLWDECDLRALALSSAEAIEAQAAAAGQRVEVRVPPGPLPMTADAQRLESAVLNLLRNAVAYGRNGGTVRLCLEQRLGEALFVVADDGPGIPVTDRDRVFERFYRGEAKGARHFPGSGLGLPIARAAVELHGGRIWVEGGPGEGTTICMSLPLAQSDAAAMAKAAR